MWFFRLRGLGCGGCALAPLLLVPFILYALGCAIWFGWFLVIPKAFRLNPVVGVLWTLWLPGAILAMGKSAGAW